MREHLRVFRFSAFKVAVAVLAVVVAFVSALPARSAVTTTTVENFDGSIQDATWRLDSYNTANDRIESSGGHPGAYLHNPVNLTTGPASYYVGPTGTAFLGDYRAANVTSLGIDFNIFSADVDRAGPYPWKIWLNLYSGTDTDDNEYDDCRITTVGALLPVPGSGWKSFSFKVPSGRASLPSNWVMEGVCNNLSRDDAWNFLVTHVSGVGFAFYGGQYATYRNWDVGIDSVRITSRTNRPAAGPDVSVGTVAP